MKKQIEIQSNIEFELCFYIIKQTDFVVQTKIPQIKKANQKCFKSYNVNNFGK